MVFITSDCDRLFLSWEACAALGKILKHFLAIGETLQSQTLTSPDAACDATEQHPPEPIPLTLCNYPHGHTPALKPTNPYSQKLKWIRCNDNIGFWITTSPVPSLVQAPTTAPDGGHSYAAYGGP